MAVFIMLIPKGEIPAWLVFVFLFREISVTALRGIAIAEGVMIPADVWGKKKTALLNAALTCFLLPPLFLGRVDSRVVGWFTLGLALVVSVGSGIHYFLNFFHEALENKRKSNL
jgi:CDP-diacylglycerol--glycerol-3-phosphate 3-phosphatidyltransferase